MVFARNAGMVVSDDESSLTDCVNFLHLRTFFSGLGAISEIAAMMMYSDDDFPGNYAGDA